MSEAPQGSVLGPLLFTTNVIFLLLLYLSSSLPQVMREAGVKRLVYSSSATVYGAPQYLPADENHPTGVGLTNPYGKTKYFCETMMEDLAASDPVGAGAMGGERDVLGFAKG